MPKQLRVSLGQHSLVGAHPVNQDFYGASQPTGYALASKGLALAIADGISSSNVSQIASAMAVNSFLGDYYSTCDAWTVRRSAQRVLAATNAWLHAQTMRGDGRFDKDRGYVCTFSALILKGRDLHMLHVGDSRICRLHAHSLERLTDDHRVWHSETESYLARALGTGPHLDIDYCSWGGCRGRSLRAGHRRRLRIPRCRRNTPGNGRPRR
jgi:serine/threonine protein phosphatase PrpC